MYFCVGFISDKDWVHQHFFRQVSLGLEGTQERVEVTSLESRRDWDIDRWRGSRRHVSSKYNDL